MNDSRIQMDSARILQGEVAAVVSTHAHQHSTAQELGGGALWKNHPELQRGDALGERTKTLDARYELDVFRLATDRKSTRLNSSHLVISYAVFCLKKKKQHDVLEQHAARRDRCNHL